MTGRNCGKLTFVVKTCANTDFWIWKSFEQQWVIKIDRLFLTRNPNNRNRIIPGFMIFHHRWLFRPVKSNCNSVIVCHISIFLLCYSIVQVGNSSLSMFVKRLVAWLKTTQFLVDGTGSDSHPIRCFALEKETVELVASVFNIFLHMYSLWHSLDLRHAAIDTKLTATDPQSIVLARKSKKYAVSRFDKWRTQDKISCAIF